MPRIDFTGRCFVKDMRWVDMFGSLRTGQDLTRATADEMQIQTIKRIFLEKGE